MDEEAIQPDVMMLKYKRHMTNTITLNTPALYKCTSDLMHVILLPRGHQHVLVTIAAIFRVVRTRIHI
jgi:hypothetical protein